MLCDPSESCIPDANRAFPTCHAGGTTCPDGQDCPPDTYCHSIDGSATSECLPRSTDSCDPTNLSFDDGGGCGSCLWCFGTFVPSPGQSTGTCLPYTAGVGGGFCEQRPFACGPNFYCGFNSFVQCLEHIAIRGQCGPAVADPGDGCVSGSYCDPSTQLCTAPNLKPGDACPIPITPDRDPCM